MEQTRNQLHQAAYSSLVTCLGLQPQETLLIVTDTQTPIEITQSLQLIATQIGSETIILTLKPRQFDGQELPEIVAQALLHCHVFIGPTTKSFSHTNARRAATAKGIRGATLPGITLDMFQRLMAADYSQIASEAKSLLTQINAASSCHITAPNGTDINLQLANHFEPDDGILDKPGAFGNLPAGEVMGAPSNSNGTLVFDVMGTVITEPTRLTVVDNIVTDIESNPSGTRLRTLLYQAAAQDGNRNAYHIAELGIGLNPLAKITGNVLEDEKVLGTCHIALGDNTSYPGGTNQASIHIDGIINHYSIECK